MGDIPCPHLEDKVLICEESHLPLQSDRPSTQFQFCLRGWGRFFSVGACLLAIVFILVLLLTEEMGQTQMTPLDLTLRHWEDVKSRANNMSVLVKKDKWNTLASADWPVFQVGWPPGGSFSLPLIQAVKKKVFGTRSHVHQDQIPYILVWENLVTEPPHPLASALLTPPIFRRFCTPQRPKRT